MKLRSFSRVAIAAAAVLHVSQARSDEVAASFRPDVHQASDQTGSSAYRLYAKEQADALVGMTKVLAREIKDGNLEAAQSAYAPTHRYLTRIAPILGLLPDLYGRMDARADRPGAKEAAASLSGFHRIEFGLFSDRSTSNLIDVAAQLLQDALDLRKRVMLADLEPEALIAASAKVTRDLADKGLAGDEERYARTDLWDLEAGMDGVQEVLTRVAPRLPASGMASIARADAHFAEFGRLLAKHKAGCGFVSYDEVGADDRLALRAPVAALAAELTALRTKMAMD